MASMPTTSATPRGEARAGFSLVEVIVAVVILAVGILGLAGTTAYVVRQVTLADLTTERAAAVQTAMERLQALPYDSLRSGSDSVGVFRVEWTPLSVGLRSTEVEIVTTGPGRRRGTGGSGMPVVSGGVPDTVVYRILDP